MSRQDTSVKSAIKEEEYDVIGQERAKIDSWDKCTGEFDYADDLDQSRLYHGKLKRSTEAHAQIVDIDITAAKQLDGVKAVITGSDLPRKYGIMPAAEDETALAQSKVRYVGEPVAAVAAVDEETAQQATDAIDVTYEPLESYMSIREALDAPEHPIHSDTGEEGNVDREVALEFGDIEEEMDAAAHVQDDVFFYQGNTHLAIEQHSITAKWDRHKEKLHLWGSTQVPHYLHRTLAKALDLPERQIRVHAVPNGGGFGGKSDPLPHQICAAKLSMETNRPVKITLTREEVFYAHRGRHPVLMKIQTGVDEDGNILAMDFTTFLDGGAYGSYGPATTYYTGAIQTVTYHIPNYRFRGLRVNTNKPPCGPKRGHGTPQPRFGLEKHMDRIAENIGKDPIEFRKQNFTGEYELTANWLEITTNGVEKCTDAVLEDIETKESMSDCAGTGFAVGAYLSGAGLPIYWNKMPHSEVQIKVDRSGNVTVFSGATDIGQGSDSTLASIVAEVFGLQPEEITIETADTDTTPVDLGTYSSRVTMMMGNAAKEAAMDALDQIISVVAETTGSPKENLQANNGKIINDKNPDVEMTLKEAIELTEETEGLIGSTGSYTPPDIHGEYKGAGVGPSPAYSFSACAAQVEVDPETGEIDFDRIWLAHDVGQALNPTSVEGQIEGSVYMGLGEALMEEQTFHKNGLHRAPSMLDYKSPTASDMPTVESTIIETNDDRGPFGAKEAGQGPLLPVAPAVVSAIEDAVDIECSETPITPEKITQAKQSGQEIGPNSIPDYEFPEPIQVNPPEEVQR